MLRVLLLYWVASAYSIVRYIVFAPENLQNLPVFVLNKAISMGAAFCFVLAFWQQWRRLRGRASGNEPGIWFRAGLFGVVAHIPLALTILSPAYFKEFYAGERLSMAGETIFLFGALSAGGIYLLTRANWNAAHRWWLSLLTVCAIFNHTLFMGISRGIKINQAHAYLPPMWMFSVIALGLGIAYLLMSRPRPEASTSVTGSAAG